MLETLLNDKVKGGKWHALIDKVFRELNLFDAARKVLQKKGAAGVDQQTVTDFADHEREEIRSLHEELREGRYRPSPVRRALSLNKSYLDQSIMEELRTWTPESGVPQGAVLSPVLANLYLNPLDHQMAEAGFEMVRLRR